MGDEPLAEAKVTAKMSQWLTTKDAYGDECVFGFALQHPSTGGLSWVLSTAIVELSTDETRARTRSSRVYDLGQRISIWDLDDEGSVALNVLTSDGTGGNHAALYADIRWVTACKMARHLKVDPPQRGNTVAVDEFHRRHAGAYVGIIRSLRS